MQQTHMPPQTLATRGGVGRHTLYSAEPAVHILLMWSMKAMHTALRADGTEGSQSFGWCIIPGT